jgi:uncharacterized protein (TIGR00106 family)
VRKPRRGCFGLSYTMKAKQQRKKDENTLMEISLLPIGSGESVSAQLSLPIQRIQKSGLKHQVNAMSTLVEGQLDECMTLAKACMRDLLKSSPRISCSIQFDIHPGKDGQMEENVEAIEQKTEQTNAPDTSVEMVV